ncbi:transmembrane protein 214 [Diachasmimorpha longicaudata]|uniref:transmembrane protein 214 n=1 Tax=Diachasmimorpha longicaudata TaxID=58733 RepID=UPI0030B871CF
MSSGGWEVVGKNKKDKVAGRSAKLSKAEKKKFIENAPKVEDFLPLNQVKTLYDNLDGDKENKKPKEKDLRIKGNDEKKKQQQQQQKSVQNDKKKLQVKEKPKGKPSKLAEKNGLTVEKITELLETNRTRFPDAPLIWLKDLVAYVNATVSQEKSPSTVQAISDTHPLSLIPKSIRTIFEKVIKSVGLQNIQMFYEGTLHLMVKNMSNDSPDMGSKIFLQLLGQMYPEITMSNIEKHIGLRNSYQNKKLIGFSLLWALSQPGYKNLGVGLTLWHEVMAPMLESKTYANYVMQILKNTLSTHTNSNNLTQPMFIQIFDDLYSGKINISTSVEREIRECGELLKTVAMKSSHINHALLFENSMERITSKTHPTFRDELLKIMTACIVAKPECLASWINLHAKHLYQSELLLKQLDDEWYELCTQIQFSALRRGLKTLGSMEIRTKKGKEEACVAACRKRAQDLSRKMTSSSKKQDSFPWKKGSLLLLLLIGAVVAYDCRNHGSFKASITGRLVKTSGAAGYMQNAFAAAKFYCDQGLVYLEAASPEYYKVVADSTKQYSKLAGDFYLVGRDLIVKFYNETADYVELNRPIFWATIDEYCPGLIPTFQLATRKTLEITKHYSILAADSIVGTSTSFIKWLETRIFVGNWSPENIRGYAWKAVDSTQEYASQTYDWVYDKVQTLSKVR